MFSVKSLHITLFQKIRADIISLLTSPVNLEIKNIFIWIKAFQPSVAFHIETSHLICILNQMTGFYITCNTEHWVEMD